MQQDNNPEHTATTTGTLTGRKKPGRIYTDQVNQQMEGRFEIGGLQQQETTLSPTPVGQKEESRGTVGTESLQLNTVICFFQHVTLILRVNLV